MQKKERVEHNWKLYGKTHSHEPAYAVNERVCFMQNGEYGIGKITKLSVKQSGTREAQVRYVYEADIMVLYRVPPARMSATAWPDICVLLEKLDNGHARKKSENLPHSKEILKKISDKNFCLATFYALRNMYCRV